jgi:hypothetical protein
LLATGKHTPWTRNVANFFPYLVKQRFQRHDYRSWTTEQKKVRENLLTVIRERLVAGEELRITPDNVESYNMNDKPTLNLKGGVYVTSPDSLVEILSIYMASTTVGVLDGQIIKIKPSNALTALAGMTTPVDSDINEQVYQFAPTDLDNTDDSLKDKAAVDVIKMLDMFRDYYSTDTEGNYYTYLYVKEMLHAKNRSFFPDAYEQVKTTEGVFHRRKKGSSVYKEPVKVDKPEVVSKYVTTVNSAIGTNTNGTRSFSAGYFTGALMTADIAALYAEASLIKRVCQSMTALNLVDGDVYVTGTKSSHLDALMYALKDVTQRLVFNSGAVMSVGHHTTKTDSIGLNLIGFIDLSTKIPRDRNATQKDQAIQVETDINKMYRYLFPNKVGVYVARTTQEMMLSEHDHGYMVSYLPHDATVLRVVGVDAIESISAIRTLIVQAANRRLQQLICTGVPFSSHFVKLGIPVFNLSFRIISKKKVKDLGLEQERVSETVSGFDEIVKVASSQEIKQQIVEDEYDTEEEEEIMGSDSGSGKISRYAEVKKKEMKVKMSPKNKQRDESGWDTSKSKKSKMKNPPFIDVISDTGKKKKVDTGGVIDGKITNEPPDTGGDIVDFAIYDM